jgi:hypothetical protein
MKSHIFSLAALLAALSLPAAAFDFGLSLSNDSTYTSQGDWTWQQVDRALAWASVPAGASADLYLSALYEFKGSWMEDSSDVDPWRIDAGRAELSGSVPAAFGPASVFRYSLGRIETGDFSTLVLSGLSDGTRLEADFGNASAYLSGGYRGLLYKDDAYSLLSENDLEISADDDRYWAPARAFAGAGFRLSEFVPEHDIGLECLAQFDLSKADEKVFTEYLEPYVRGRLSYLLGWEAWGIVELGQDRGDEDDAFWSAAFGQKLVLSMPEKAGLRITESAQWASGEQGSMRSFSPIRSATIDATSYFRFTDLLKLKLDAGLSPVRGLALDLGAAGYFRSSSYDPEGLMAFRSGASYFRGLEISAGASAKVTSDLSLNFSSGVLVPNTKTAYEESVDSRYSVELYAVLDI